MLGTHHAEIDARTPKERKEIKPNVSLGFSSEETEQIIFQHPIDIIVPDNVYLEDYEKDTFTELELEESVEIFIPKKVQFIKQEPLPSGIIEISQSLIKKLVDRFQNEKEFCPKYIHDCLIYRTHKSIQTEDMLKGKFFESMTIGGTAHGDKLVTDLPRKVLSKKKQAELIAAGKPLIGEKKVDQLRIEYQIERFKLKLKERGIEIKPGVNTQIRIVKRWNEFYVITGELDIFPTVVFYEEQLRLAIVDLKLTADITTTGGEFCWGSPKHMDHCQGDIYHYLVRDIDFSLNPHLKELLAPNLLDIIKHDEILFLYWVWGYREPLENQEILIEREYQERPGSNFRQSELKERIRKTIGIIEREKGFGWPANPCQASCPRCPHNKNHGGTCNFSIVLKV